MTFFDVLMMRLQDQARSLCCSVAQDVETRELVIIPVAGPVMAFPDVAMARSWLRVYGHCGTHGRRCSTGCFFQISI